MIRPGPNIGWRPRTSALDLSMAFTGPDFKDVMSTNKWFSEAKGASDSITSTVKEIGNEKITTSDWEIIS